MTGKMLQLVLLLSIVYACVCQKKQSSESINDGTKISKLIVMNNANFSPGTFALNIKITEIAEKEEHYQVKAIVNKTLGFGSGITRIFTDGEIISFEIPNNQNITKNTGYCFLFKEKHSIDPNEPKLFFINELNK